MTGLLDRLAELREAVASEPWRIEDRNGPRDICTAKETLVATVPYLMTKRAADRLELAVLAVNALPTLLRIARAAEEALAEDYGSETHYNYGSLHRTVHWDRLDSAKVAEFRSALASLGDTHADALERSL